MSSPTEPRVGHRITFLRLIVLRVDMRLPRITSHNEASRKNVTRSPTGTGNRGPEI